MFVLRLLYQAVFAQASPHQLAMGFATGIALGLLPQQNVLFVGLAIVLLLSPFNLSAILAGFLTSIRLVPLVQPLIETLGSSLLTIAPLKSLLHQFFQLPWSAWTDLNNTLMIGGLFAGAAQLYFTYCLTKPFFAWSLDGIRKLFGAQTVH